MDDQRFSSTWDCIIIGGGPAGLTCALFMGRYRRRVIVVYDGPTRNFASHGVNGLLGHNGVPPAELLRRGREEADAVGVQFAQCRAESITRKGELFHVGTTAGTLRGRRVVLAYGVRDLTPDLPRFKEFYGHGIHHCPDCDGYESRDRAIGIVGKGKPAAGLALEMLQWSDRVRIFTNGELHSMSRVQVSKLMAKNVDIRDDRIIELVDTGGELSGVVLQSGERVDVESLFFTIGVVRATTLAEDAGCEVDPVRPNVTVNRQRETTVKGIYAIGDLVRGSQLVVTAAAHGAIAAIAINKSLMEPARRV